jgi:hypothetical protein
MMKKLDFPVKYPISNADPKNLSFTAGLLVPRSVQSPITTFAFNCSLKAVQLELETVFLENFRQNEIQGMAFHAMFRTLNLICGIERQLLRTGYGTTQAARSARARLGWPPIVHINITRLHTDNKDSGLKMVRIL